MKKETKILIIVNCTIWLFAIYGVICAIGSLFDALSFIGDEMYIEVNPHSMPIVHQSSKCEKIKGGIITIKTENVNIELHCSSCVNEREWQKKIENN